MLCRFNITLPVKEAVYQFFIEGWNRFAYVDTSAFDHEPVLPHHTSLACVLPAIFGIEPKKAAVMAAHHATYHLHLGFARQYMYVTPHSMPAYLANPHITSMRSTGKVVLIPWRIPECLSPLSSCTKAWMLAHIVLALWGSGEHIMLVDVDEVLALRKKTSISRFMQHCVGDASIANFWRYNMVCDNCSASHTELDLWTSETMHPLKHYTTNTGFEPETAGKCIVNPEYVHGFGIHDGALLQGERKLVSMQCGCVIHLPNLFKQRHTPDEWNTTWAEWNWAVPDDMDIR